MSLFDKRPQSPTPASIEDRLRREQTSAIADLRKEFADKLAATTASYEKRLDALRRDISSLQSKANAAQYIEVANRFAEIDAVNDPAYFAAVRDLEKAVSNHPSEIGAGVVIAQKGIHLANVGNLLLRTLATYGICDEKFQLEVDVSPQARTEWSESVAAITTYNNTHRNFFEAYKALAAGKTPSREIAIAANELSKIGRANELTAGIRGNLLPGGGDGTLEHFVNGVQYLMEAFPVEQLDVEAENKYKAHLSASSVTTQLLDDAVMDIATDCGLRYHPLRLHKELMDHHMRFIRDSRTFASPYDTTGNKEVWDSKKLGEGRPLRVKLFTEMNDPRIYFSGKVVFPHVANPS